MILKPILDRQTHRQTEFYNIKIHAVTIWRYAVTNIDLVIDGARFKITRVPGESSLKV